MHDSKFKWAAETIKRHDGERREEEANTHFSLDHNRI